MASDDAASPPPRARSGLPAPRPPETSSQRTKNGAGADRHICGTGDDDERRLRLGQQHPAKPGLVATAAARALSAAASPSIAHATTSTHTVTSCLILRTNQSFSAGRVSTDGQQGFHRQVDLTHVVELRAAVASAKHTTRTVWIIGG